MRAVAFGDYKGSTVVYTDTGFGGGEKWENGAGHNNSLQWQLVSPVVLIAERKLDFHLVKKGLECSSGVQFHNRDILLFHKELK